MAKKKFREDMSVEELDELYRQGYEKFPEDPDLGEAMLILAGEVLPEEEW